MPTVLQFRRGTTSQNNSFTGALGEITYDTDKDVLRVHDGSTAGGFSMVSASSTDTFTNKTLTSPNITTSIIPTSADGATIGSASKEFSDLFLADAGTIQFGNDQEVQLIHTADTGLILKHTATADDKPVSLTLQTGETDIAADDILGKIDFQAPDEGTGTDSILVAAGILAKSEGDFSTSSNATSLIFKTGASEAATEKVAIRSDGDMRLLTDTATLAMGADQDVTITHVADSGLTLKNSATGDDKPFTMTQILQLMMLLVLFSSKHLTKVQGQMQSQFVLRSKQYQRVTSLLLLMQLRFHSYVVIQRQQQRKQKS